MINIQIIGRIRSCYIEKWGTPRQGRYCSNSIANIEFNSEIFTKNELLKFNKYSHVLIVFIFHLNKIKGVKLMNTGMYNPLLNTCFLYKNINAKIIPPKATEREKMGCLATRSPHRPVPVGLTICSLNSIDVYRMSMSINGIDIVDQTPVIEVIPYNPSFSISRELVKFPDWVSAKIGELAFEQKVYFSLASFFDIISFVKRKTVKNQDPLGETLIDSSNKLFKLIIQTLRIDPRSRYSKSKNNHKLFGIKLLDNLQLIYFHSENFIKVIRLIDSKHFIVRNLNPRTKKWFIRVKRFISLNLE